MKDRKKVKKQKQEAQEAQEAETNRPIRCQQRAKITRKTTIVQDVGQSTQI